MKKSGSAQIATRRTKTACYIAIWRPGTRASRPARAAVEMSSHSGSEIRDPGYVGRTRGFYDPHTRIDGALSTAPAASHGKTHDLPGCGTGLSCLPDSARSMGTASIAPKGVPTVSDAGKSWLIALSVAARGGAGI